MLKYLTETTECLCFKLLPEYENPASVTFAKLNKKLESVGRSWVRVMEPVCHIGNALITPANSFINWYASAVPWIEALQANLASFVPSSSVIKFFVPETLESAFAYLDACT